MEDKNISTIRSKVRYKTLKQNLLNIEKQQSSMNQDPKKIIFSLHTLERKVLPYLHLTSIKEIAQKSNLQEKEVIAGIQLLEQRGYAKFEKKEYTVIELDKFGKKFAEKGLPEIRLLKKLEGKAKPLSKIPLEKDEIGAALGELKKRGLIEVRKDKELIISPKKEATLFIKKAQNPLLIFKKPVKKENLDEQQKKIVLQFKVRKGFLRETKMKSFSHSITPEGKKLQQFYKEKFNDVELEETLTSEMLKTGSWKNKTFRHYDVSIKTSPLAIGRRHPMLEANNILKEIFIEMGFKEMQGPIVESAFWNMDTMWIPQDHPARDEQDTFYLEGKADVPKELIQKVKQMHEEGMKKTHTPPGDWSEDITKKRLLRTHSTATSFRTLYELGKKLKRGENINGKYFYLAPVFRNEAVDATHLAEFYQAEGFIVGDDLSLADLMGFIKEYYAKLGITKTKFKPTYNPYTEPSMEAHYYDPKLKKWYALINSGIFRPETLKPLGLENKTIIAWGIGASRVATLLTGAESMRDITGATCDFEWLETRPMMRRQITKR